MTKLTLPRPAPMFATMAREMDEVQNRLRRFFGEGFPIENAPLTEPVGWLPVVEIVEKPDELLLTAELPGMAKENVEVLFEDEVLTIRGEKKEEKEEGNGDKRYHLWERSYGAFQRSFTLPRAIDATKIVAEFNNGVLKVRMPKTAPEKAKGRKIEIAAK
jgi:HSP20 family protein